MPPGRVAARAQQCYATAQATTMSYLMPQACTTRRREGEGEGEEARARAREEGERPTLQEPKNRSASCDGCASDAHVSSPWLTVLLVGSCSRKSPSGASWQFDDVYMHVAALKAAN